MRYLITNADCMKLGNTGTVPGLFGTDKLNWLVVIHNTEKGALRHDLTVA